jgi:hypothetical protein
MCRQATSLGSSMAVCRRTADIEQAGDHPVEQVLAAVRLLRGDSRPGDAHQVIALAGLGEVTDHGQGEVTGRGRHRAEAHLDRERGAVLAQPDQRCPITHRPGPGRPRVTGPVAAVGRPQVGRDERLNWTAGQVGVPIAKHLRYPAVDQDQPAIAVGQRHPVGERVDELEQHGLGDGPRPGPAARPGCPWLASCPRGPAERRLAIARWPVGWGVKGITAAGTVAAVAASREV